MKKYNWSDELCDEVVEYLKAEESHLNVVAGHLLRKLHPPDPRPNFREADVCMCCTAWYPCDSEKALGTCDNFTREAEEPAVIFNDCNNCAHIEYQCDGVYVYDEVKCPDYECVKAEDETVKKAEKFQCHTCKHRKSTKCFPGIDNCRSYERAE